MLSSKLEEAEGRNAIYWPKEKNKPMIFNEKSAEDKIKIEFIEKEELIKDAVDLKEDAQKMLAEYERKFRGAEKEAAEMLKRSEHEVEVLKRETLQRLEADMKKREEETKAHLALAEENAAGEVAVKTAELTMATVRKLLQKELDDKAQGKLIDEAIKELEKAV